MRTTDFCFPLLRLRVPVPHVLPASLRGLRLALGRRACTRDQETGGPGVFTMPDPLWRASSSWRSVCFSGAPNSAVPRTPLSLPFRPRRAFARNARFESPRPLLSPLR